MVKLFESEEEFFAPTVTQGPTVAEAFFYLTDLVEFAYENGYHEIGYDPLQYIKNALEFHGEEV